MSHLENGEQSGLDKINQGPEMLTNISAWLPCSIQTVCKLFFLKKKLQHPQLLTDLTHINI